MNHEKCVVSEQYKNINHGGQPPMMHKDCGPVFAPNAIADNRGRYGPHPIVEASLGNHFQDLLQIRVLHQVVQIPLVGADV